MRARLVAAISLFAVGIFAAVGLTVASALTTETSKGVFIVRCPLSKQKQVDPIVSPGPKGTLSGHLHDFFGNNSVDSDSTYSTAFRAGTTCEFFGDHAGYWTPSLIAPNGTVVTARTAFSYYRNQPLKYGTTKPFPADFRVVAGGVGVGFPYASWHCEGNLQRFATPPYCSAGTLEAEVLFPNCSDGRADSPDHRSHVRYPTSTMTCPASHPIKLPELLLHVRYKVPGGAGYRLSDGTLTPHADFWNTWVQASLEDQVRRCLNVGINCGALIGG